MFKVEPKVELFLEHHVSGLTHSYGTYLSHLWNTACLLNSWKLEPDVSLAGLFHSVYGSHSFKVAPISLDHRSELRELIGERAEKLSYLFCFACRDSLMKVGEISGRIAIPDRRSDQSLWVEPEELPQLLSMELANWLEQRPRKPVADQWGDEKEWLAICHHLPDLAVKHFRRCYDLD